MELTRSNARVTVTTLVALASKNADFTGTGFDLRGYTGIVKVKVQAAEVSGTNPTLTLSIKDSANNSSFAATAATDTDGNALSVAAVDGAIDKTWTIDVAKFDSARPYIAIDGDLGGTNPVYYVTATIIGQKQYP